MFSQNNNFCSSATNRFAAARLNFKFVRLLLLDENEMKQLEL